MAGSLYYVWGLVEGLQIVESMGLFAAKVPANAGDFLENFGKLASFEFIDIAAIIRSAMYYPERDAYSLNFQAQGHDSVYAIPLLGTTFLLILLLGVLVLYDLMLKAYSLKSPSIGSVRRRCTQGWLYWNFIVRLFTEIYMNLTLFTMVNLMEMEWDSNLAAANFSNLFSILATCIVFTAPVALIVLTSRNLRDHKTASFQRRFGAVVEGIELDFTKRDEQLPDIGNKRWLVMFTPSVHYARRMLLCISLTLFKEIFWA